MGNRAVIRTPNSSKGVYCHWNGGRDTVEGILEFLKRNKYKFDTEEELLKKISEVYINCFSSRDRVEDVETLDMNNGDNGTYFIDRIRLEIVGRMYNEGEEQQVHPLDDLVAYIEKFVLNKVTA